MNIDFIHDNDGFDGLAPVWNGLLQRSATDVPFLQFEYLRSWWATRGGGEWPGGELWLAVGRDGAGAVQGIAPLFCPSGESSKRLLFLGSIEISDYLDVVAPSEHLGGFTRGLIEALEAQDRPGVRALDLYNIPGGAPSLAAWQEAAAEHGWTVRRETLQPCPVITLDGTWDAYLGRLDRKQRHELRRKIRRAQDHLPPAVLRIVQSAADIESAMEVFLRLMATDPAKAAFLTPAMREHFRRLASPDHRTPGLQLAFLDVGQEPAAGYLSFDYAGRVWVYNSCLNPAFASLSPGWVLVGQMIRWAIEQGRGELDFLRGGEDYKYQLGGVGRSILRLTLTS